MFAAGKELGGLLGSHWEGLTSPSAAAGAGGTSGILKLMLSSLPTDSCLSQTQPTPSFSPLLPCPHLPARLGPGPSPQGGAAIPSSSMPASDSQESQPPPWPRRRVWRQRACLRLTSPPAGCPDPCCMQLSIPAATAAVSAAAAALFYT